MLPLSAIPHAAVRAYGLQPHAEIAPAELTSMPGAAGEVKPTGDSFGSLLGKLVSEVNTKQMAAGDALSRLQSGGDINLHQAVIAMEEANVSFQLMVEVRNKLLESYQELMRLNV